MICSFDDLQNESSYIFGSSYSANFVLSHFGQISLKVPARFNPVSSLSSGFCIKAFISFNLLPNVLSANCGIECDKHVSEGLLPINVVLQILHFEAEYVYSPE